MTTSSWPKGQGKVLKFVLKLVMINNLNTENKSTQSSQDVMAVGGNQGMKIRIFVRQLSPQPLRNKLICHEQRFHRQGPTNSKLYEVVSMLWVCERSMRMT